MTQGTVKWFKDSKERMASKVSEEILKQTTKCVFDFKCLNEETRDVCRVDRCIGGLCFLETIKSGLCSYKYSFENSCACLCPTRAELYRNYRI
jgi:hypothetical protein